jgi:hypothetical protein
MGVGEERLMGKVWGGGGNKIMGGGAGRGG